MLKLNVGEDTYQCPDCGCFWTVMPPDHGIKDIWISEQKYKKDLAKKNGGGSQKVKKRKDKPKVKPKWGEKYET